MDWTSLLGVLLGGLLALAGQALQSLTARRGEIRRRTDEAALAARAELLEIREVYDNLPNPDQSDPLVEQREHLKKRIRNFRAALALIADSTVRDRLNFVVRGLSNSNDIQQFYGDTRPQACRYLCQWGDDVIGAYLRGQRQTKEPEKIEKYRLALQEAEEVWERRYRDLEDDLQAKPEGKRQSTGEIDTAS